MVKTQGQSKSSDRYVGITQLLSSSLSFTKNVEKLHDSGLVKLVILSEETYHVTLGADLDYKET